MSDLTMAADPDLDAALGTVWDDGQDADDGAPPEKTPPAAKPGELTTDAEADEAAEQRAADEGQDAKKAAKAAPERDETGKFKGKDTKADGAKDAQPEAAKKPDDGGEPAKPAIDPPKSWSAKDKAAWARLAPEAQEIILRREAEVSRGFQERAEHLKRLEPVQRLLESRQRQFELDGMTGEQAVRQLFQLSDMAAKDPAGFIRWFAQQRGINPAQFFSHAGGQPGGQQQQPGARQPDPQLVQAMREIQGLKQHLVTQQQTDQQRRVQQQVETIQRWAADPENPKPHFAVLEGIMTQLFNAKLASTLDEAYEKAISLHPEVSQLVKAERAAEAERRRKAEAGDAARRARSAATPIRSGGGYSDGRVKADDLPLDDQLNQVWDRMAG